MGNTVIWINIAAIFGPNSIDFNPFRLWTDSDPFSPPGRATGNRPVAATRAHQWRTRTWKKTTTGQAKTTRGGESGLGQPDPPTRPGGRQAELGGVEVLLVGAEVAPLNLEALLPPQLRHHRLPHLRVCNRSISVGAKSGSPSLGSPPAPSAPSPPPAAPEIPGKAHGDFRILRLCGGFLNGCGCTGLRVYRREGAGLRLYGAFLNGCGCTGLRVYRREGAGLRLYGAFLNGCGCTGLRVYRREGAGLSPRTRVESAGVDPCMWYGCAGVLVCGCTGVLGCVRGRAASRGCTKTFPPGPAGVGPWVR
eukprot:9493685-Pyramimonas_sp.AAC.1